MANRALLADYASAQSDQEDEMARTRHEDETETETETAKPDPSAEVAKQQEDADTETQRKLAEAAERDGEERMKNAPDPENPDDQDKFNSLLTRDTTHFQNVHYTGHGPTDRITGGSSQARVELVQHLLQATGAQVAPGMGWDYATQKAIMDVNENGEVDRATWDKLSDLLFADDSDKYHREPKPASVPTGN